MVLGCPKQTPQGLGTVTGDTHAASLTGSQSNTGPTVNFNGSTAVNPGVSIITDNTERTVQSAIPTALSSTQAIGINITYNFSQSTGAVTVRVRRNGTLLNTLTVTAATWGSYTLLDTGFSVGANTYIITAQQNGGTLNAFASIGSIVINDTHAATLTGSSGTCT